MRGCGVFLSVASLCGLDRVDACHVRERCTGLLIRYVDGPPAVLGEWNTTDASQHSCIYKRSDGKSITKVCFRMLKYYPEVADVELLTDASYASLGNDNRVYDNIMYDNRVFRIDEVRLDTSLEAGR